MRHVICMVSDFFYPNLGGVESHIFTLSQCLITLGHKVIVITHSYGNRVGVRYMTNGLKVYYLPIKTMHDQVVLPTLFASLSIFRNIYIRECVEIVHGHSAFSTLAHEGIVIARLLGLKAVFTDHSLNGFADISAILTNKLLEITLSGVNHCICVSHTGKENTVLRAKVPANHVSVIPNATDTTLFKPDVTKKETDQIIIVALSRLVYRKGIDLLASVIPIICKKYPKVHFLIGGDGPKRLVLEQVREREGLHERVSLLGALDQSEVHGTLLRGHIFLNTSLTEAYCIAIVEAAACGLQVVSTKVGGIPEVLPPEMIRMAQPDVSAIVSALDDAIDSHLKGTCMSPWECHQFIHRTYNWVDIATRTQLVYDDVKQQPSLSVGKLLCSRYRNCGPVAGPFFVLIFTICHILLQFFEWLYPRHLIDIAPDYNNEKEL
ncbi:phosphatidylinositol N-acetylglucosaminyltransferase subunit A-like isoform X1 [Daphnia pulicaria]|uniref:phosphatidylinositol N-acetylglucosaminyltransferase subunit A-like isoform X1 n=1 Tax=Daphnia pulicaria TaxID=35523 RepID=UPI001EEC317C|nr:phosphatidylinositol N-acetylglucosaminyltransferase subunit A-like isoform X1 [Daphnia pulicaria]